MTTVGQSQHDVHLELSKSSYRERHDEDGEDPHQTLELLGLLLLLGTVALSGGGCHSFS